MTYVFFPVVVGIATWIVCGPFVRSRENLLLLFPPMAIYLIAWVTWNLGMYLNIVPSPRTGLPRGAWANFLVRDMPPVITPLLFGAWMALNSRSRARSSRRPFPVHLFKLFAGSVISAVVIAGGQLLFPSGLTWPPVLIAVVAMGGVAIVALWRDHHIEAAVMFLGVASLAAVPVVLLGRVIATALATLMGRFIWG